MRKSILIAAAAAMVVVASAASAQGRPERVGPSVAFFTPPIGSNNMLGHKIEASFVSTGTAPIDLTIELCNLAGQCNSAGFGCLSLSFTRGQGCWTGDLVVEEPFYAKFRVRPTGGGTVDGMGSLRLIGPDGTTAAVQTRGPVPDRAVTEQ